MEKIFIKKGPDRFIEKKYEMAVLNGLKDLNYECSPYGVYKIDETNNFSPIITYSYDGTGSFWKAYCDSNYRIYMEDCSSNVIKEDYLSKYELDKKFISLEDFLKKAEFIGQEGHRTKALTKPLNNFNVCLDKDSKYMEEGIYIILYRYNGNLLVFNKSNQQYEIINSKYTYDNNFEFNGPIHYDMANKNNIINAIYNQLSDNKTKKR